MKRVFLILFCCSAFCGYAQQHTLRQYTAIDGLPQSQVNAMLEDAFGYLWVGTNGGGLARFNGKEFKVYNTIDGLLSNTITSLMIDAKQNIWIVHPRGLTRFDGSDFKKFQAPDPSYNQGRIRRAYELGDTVFFVSSPGVVGKIYRDSVHYWYRPILKNKLIYFGIRSQKKEICYYLNDSSLLIISHNGIRKHISHKAYFNKAYNIFNYRNKLIIDSDKGYYSIGNNDQLIKEELAIRNRIVGYDTVTHTFWTRNNEVLLREELGVDKVDTVIRDIIVTQILFDKEGNSWIGTSGNGLYRHYVRDFDRCASDKLGAVMAINIDRAGATWLGTLNKGLWKIRKGKIKNYFQHKTKEEAITTIKISPAGEVWVGSFKGLGRYDSLRDDFDWRTRENGLSSQYIMALEFDPSGKLWSGTANSGVDFIDNKKITNVSLEQGLNSRNIFSLKYFKRMGKLYVGTDLGLNVISDDFKASNIPIPELDNTAVNSLSTYRDSILLIGSSGAGVILYNPVDRSSKKISVKDGLPSNLIYFVDEDSDHALWIGTEQGISRVTLNENLEVIQNFHYGHDNGLTGVEANQNAYFFGKEKYFGLIDGVYQYNQHERFDKKSNQLHLTNVDLFYGETSMAPYASERQTFFKIPFPLSLPPDKNHLTFSFSRVDKRNPQAVKYKYYLENYDKAWSLPVAVGRVTYGNLPAGEYALHVLATKKDGSWDDSPLKYAFEVHAPFYQRATFMVMAAILLIGLILLSLYWRVRSRVNKVLEVERIRQQELEHLRKEIARDFHDEMGNQLTRIINYISLMKLSHNGHTAELYNKVEQSAKYLYNGTRDFIWSIDPVNDELSKLFIHIRDFGEKLFEEKGIQFRAFNHLKEKIKVPYGFCREANLIFKEAMTNAFNHSGAKNVSFCMNKTDEGFEIVLEDDGEGFTYNELGQPNGLKNMRSRAGRIKSTLRINGKRPGGGTLVSLISHGLKTKNYDIAI